eukprot:CAMPEP_0117771384 /NCGR_PEP_ID=MMETSP0947-20121206/24427_1 /TAXON_ID=44440 /ORGANISM="Chattonella subsalsa, Strain CCMP2191" /LENGTH=178 /DNA_ID=CAMNT_0005596723 /DNA_START=6 /DNA_END=542 /DNA_ORIENTATION=+
MASFNSREVKLNVYNLHQANGWLSYVGLGFYHTGVEIAGKEYSFCKEGIYVGRPRHAPGATFKESISMGYHEGSANEVGAIVRMLREEFPPGSYNVVSKNCNNFSDAFCQEVVGRSIPSWVNRTAGFGSIFVGDKTVTHEENGNEVKDEGKQQSSTAKKELTEQQKQLLAKLKKKPAS